MDEQFDWRAIVVEKEDYWRVAVEQFSSANRRSTTFALPDHPRFCAPVLRQSNRNTRLLYGRFMVEYSVGGVDYSDILTLSLGVSQPVGIDHGLWQSHLTKQPYTRVVSFESVVDFLRLDRLIDNHEDEVNALLPSNRRLVTFRVVAEPQGGELRYSIVHQTEKPAKEPERDSIYDRC